jgi:hypothetical protein
MNSALSVARALPSWDLTETIHATSAHVDARNIAVDYYLSAKGCCTRSTLRYQQLGLAD